MADQEPKEIVVNGQDNKLKLSDVARVVGSAATNPTGVAGQVIRNEILERAGDDLGGQKPTIGVIARLAEATGDGSNDRDASMSLARKFNDVAGANVFGVELVNFAPSPVRGVVTTVSGIVNTKETLPNAIGDTALNIVGSVPLLGAVTGVFRGDTDAREMRRGIEFYSNAGIAGFQYHEGEIDGNRVRIWVSAGDAITDINARPFVSIDTKGIREKDPRVQALAENVVGQALADVYDLEKAERDRGVDDNNEIRGALVARMSAAVQNYNVQPAAPESGRITPQNITVGSVVNGLEILGQ
jgi:hypothetical protein